MRTDGSVAAGLFATAVFLAASSVGCSGGAPARPRGDGGTGGKMGATGSGGESGGEDAGTGGADDGGAPSGSGGANGGGSGGSAGGTANRTGGATGTATGGSGSPVGGAGGAPVAGNCAKALFGRYLLRNDGFLLYEADPTSTAQTPVLDAATGLPLPDVIAVDEGYTHGCAVQGSSKTAWCWRRTAAGNSEGQLANGATDTTGPLFRATQVLTAANTPLGDVVGISTGSANSWGLNSCAIVSGGKVYCWGNVRYIANNGSAALNATYAIPITVDGVSPLANVEQIALGGSAFPSHSTGPLNACVLLQGAAAKEVWCWGGNYGANLGTGDTTSRQYPTKVVGLTNPTKVVVFGEIGTTCALDGGNVKCWGANSQGQVGNGTKNTPVLGPTVVTLMGGTTALTGIVDIAGGSDQVRDDVCALASDRTAKCWGWHYETYPTNFGVANIVSLGSLFDASFRFLTSDGVYHIGATTRAPNCGVLQ